MTEMISSQSSRALDCIHKAMRGYRQEEVAEILRPGFARRRDRNSREQCSLSAHTEHSFVDAGQPSP